MIKIRQAKKSDARTIVFLIRELARYEKLLSRFKLTENKVRKGFFVKNSVVKTLIVEVDGQPCGIAVYFYNFSTFLGSPGIYLEDLFVLPSYRGLGVGKKLFSHIANIAVRENCQRFEWSVLNWNTPALKFYKKMGAKPLKEWQVQRLEGHALNKVARQL